MPITHYSASLPKQFTVNGQTVNVQWHHIIPTTISDRFPQLLSAIGWDQNLISKNLIPLAADDRSAAILGTARHSGGHSG